jgi:hypothetical protein
LQSSQTPMLNASIAPLALTQSAKEVGSSVESKSIVTASMTGTHNATRSRISKNAIMPAANPLAQNAVQVHDPKSDESASTETSDHAAVMISHRYSKAIDVEKNEVVVSGKDRL